MRWWSYALAGVGLAAYAVTHGIALGLSIWAILGCFVLVYLVD